MEPEFFSFGFGRRCDPVRLCIPFIFYNMGAEMLYILEQRLYSQKIRKDKIERVLDDLVQQLYGPRAICELLKKGPLPSNSYMRSVFHAISNSSLMKLNDQSMERMYELMVMGFKHQVVSLSHPMDIVSVTLNHMEANRTLVKAGTAARQLVDNALVQLTHAMKKITLGQYHMMRSYFCRFFQDRRTKVSLFMREGLQNPNGTFPLVVGGPMPNDILVEMPGVVRYFNSSASPSSGAMMLTPDSDLGLTDNTVSGSENGDTVRHEQDVSNPQGHSRAQSSTEAFNHPLTWHITTQRKGDHYDFEARDVVLGANLYIAQEASALRETLRALEPPTFRFQDKLAAIDAQHQRSLVEEAKIHEREVVQAAHQHPSHAALDEGPRPSHGAATPLSLPADDALSPEAKPLLPSPGTQQLLQQQQSENSIMAVPSPSPPAQRRPPPSVAAVPEGGMRSIPAEVSDTAPAGDSFITSFLQQAENEHSDSAFRFSPFGDPGQSGVHEAGSVQPPLEGGECGDFIEIQAMSRDRYVEINSELVGMMEELEVLDKVYMNPEADVSSSSLLELLREEGLA